MYKVDDIKSYDIAQLGLPPKVESIVYVAHIAPLLEVDKYLKHTLEVDIAIGVSLRSSYRSKAWEHSKGRSGSSSHTFTHLGATDVTCSFFAGNWFYLLKGLIEKTRYTRFAIYHTVHPETGVKGGFIHCDYKNAQSDAYVYKVVNGKWLRDYPLNRAA